MQENEFVNVYVETLFEDINGKNRELVLLKANSKVLAKENEDLKASLETKTDETKERTHRLETRIMELEEQNRNLSAKVDANQSSTENVLRLEQDLKTMQRNYELVRFHNEELRNENESLKKSLLPPPDWEESAIVEAEKPSRRKKGLTKINAAEVSA